MRRKCGASLLRTVCHRLFHSAARAHASGPSGPHRTILETECPHFARGTPIAARIAFAVSPSTARTSAKKDFYMASPFAAIPNITPLVRTIHHLSVAASYATEFGTGGSSMIFNNQQSVVIQKWLVM